MPSHPRFSVGLPVRATWLLALASTLPAPGDAQDRNLLLGSVVTVEDRAPLPAALIFLPDAGRRLLSGPDGQFRALGLEPGPHRLRIETIGRVTVDTTVVVGEGLTFAIIRMAPRAIRLAGIQADVGRCSEPGFEAPSGSEAAFAVLDELRKNAERYSAMQEAERPVLVLERTQRLLRRDGRVARHQTDTIAADTVASVYRTGEVLVSELPLIDVPGAYKMRLPGFHSLASHDFQDAHCFRYRGLAEHDGERLLRIEYLPLLSITTPDVRGSVYLDPETFVVRRATFRLTNVPPTISRMRGLTATVFFDEPAPGRVLIREIHSEQRLTNRRTPTAVEVQRRLEYRLRPESSGPA